MVSKLKALRKAVNGILDDLKSQNAARQFRGTSKVSKLLRAPQRELEWESDQVIDAVVKIGAVPILAEFLERGDDHKLQSEAANALANISAGTSENTCAVIDAGVVPIATKLLASSSTDLQDHAAWLLANIACENCACVLEAGALSPLLKLLDDAKVQTHSEQSLVKTATWLLSNLCQYTEDFEKVKDCLPRLAALIHSTDEGVLKDACWGIMYMCRLNVSAVVESGGATRLVKLLMHSSDDVCCVALEALSAIFANGNVVHKQSVLGDGVLARLRYLLHSRRERTREIACTAIGNIARGSGSFSLLSVLLENDIFTCLLRIISRRASNRAGWLTWREAVRGVTHVIEASKFEKPAVVAYLVANGLILALRSTIAEAASCSIEICVDPALRLIEQLVDAGKNPVMVPEGGSDNLYARCIVDCNIDSEVAPQTLERLWIRGYILNANPAQKNENPTPLPANLLRMSKRVQILLMCIEPASTLKAKTLKHLRKTMTIEELRESNLDGKLKAEVCGLFGTDMSLMRHGYCNIEMTLRHKDSGDRFFITQQYEQAAAAYTDALQCLSGVKVEALEVTLLLNRAAANLKIGNLNKVISDCTDGLVISPGNSKCLTCRSAAYEKSGQFEAALLDIRRVKGDEAEVAQNRIRNQHGQMTKYKDWSSMPGSDEQQHNSHCKFSAHGSGAYYRKGKGGSDGQGGQGEITDGNTGITEAPDVMGFSAHSLVKLRGVVRRYLLMSPDKANMAVA